MRVPRYIPVPSASRWRSFRDMKEELVVDNQHGPQDQGRRSQISGYRDLSVIEIDAMNALKAAEQDLLRTLDTIKGMDGVNQRSVAIARTEIQTGFMWAIRAIARPNNE